MANYVLKNDAQLPVVEIATIDYMRNAGISSNQDSEMFNTLLLRASEQYSQLYQSYDEAWAAARTADDLQPKVAILQLREDEERRNKGFSSLREIGTADCADYELIYIRNENKSLKSEDDRIEASHRLYEEFTAETLRPQGCYYGYG